MNKLETMDNMLHTQDRSEDDQRGPIWRSPRSILSKKALSPPPMDTMLHSKQNSQLGIDLNQQTMGNIFQMEKIKENDKIDLKQSLFNRDARSRPNLNHSPSSPKKKSPNLKQQVEATNRLYKNTYETSWKPRAIDQVEEQVIKPKRRRRFPSPTNKEKMKQILANQSTFQLSRKSSSSNNSESLDEIADIADMVMRKNRSGKPKRVLSKTMTKEQINIKDMEKQQQKLKNQLSRFLQSKLVSPKDIPLEKQNNSEEIQNDFINLSSNIKSKIFSRFKSKSKNNLGLVNTLAKQSSKNGSKPSSKRSSMNLNQGQSEVVDSIDIFNQIADIEISHEQLIKKQNSDSDDNSISRDSQSHQNIDTSRENKMVETKLGFDKERNSDQKMVDIVNLPPEEEKQEGKIVPMLPNLMKPKELTPEELRQLNEEQCTDLFLHFDENNVNYLTWEQLGKNFQIMGMFQLINVTDNKKADLRRRESTDAEHLSQTIQKTHKQNFDKQFAKLKKHFHKHHSVKQNDKIERNDFIKILEMANVDVPDVQDMYFDQQFNTEFDRQCTKCCKPIFKKIRKLMVRNYIKQLRNPETQVIRILNIIRKSIFENLDQIAHLTLLEKVYNAGVDPKNYDQNGYKVAFSVIFIAFFSTYLIQHSSTLKMMLQKGWYEPQVTKKNSWLELAMKLLFLTFLGPIQLILVEGLVLVMTISQLIGLIIRPKNMEGYFIVQQFFMPLFLQGFGLYEDEVEGIMKQRAIVQLFFEDLPVIVIQIMIYLNILYCPDVRDKGQWQLLFSFFMSLLEIAITMTHIKIESIALEEPIFTYVLNCFQAKQGWIPFIHQMKSNNVRTYIDYSNIKCSLPGITGKTAFYFPIRYKFSNISLQNFTQELVQWNAKFQDTKTILSSEGGQRKFLDNSSELCFNSMNDSSKSSSVSEETVSNHYEDSRKYTFDIGKSIEYVTLNMCLHFYQLAPKDRINIKFTKTQWEILIQNALKLNLCKRDSLTNKLVAKTPSGSDCLWICGDDEKAEADYINYDADQKNITLRQSFNGSMLMKSLNLNSNKSQDSPMRDSMSEGVSLFNKKLQPRMRQSESPEIGKQNILQRRLNYAKNHQGGRRRAISPLKRLDLLKPVVQKSVDKISNMSPKSPSQFGDSTLSPAKQSRRSSIKNFVKQPWVLQQCLITMLEHNFDPDIKDNSGETFVNHVIKSNKLECLKLLLDYNASSTLKNKMEMSPLGQCIVSQNLNALKIIVQKDCDIFEDQISDPKISLSPMTISYYVSKLLRFYNGYHVKFKFMLDTIMDKYNIEVKSDSDKKIFFKQFCKIFCTGKDNYLESGESLDKTIQDFYDDEEEFEQYKKARDSIYNDKQNVAHLLKRFNSQIDILYDTDNEGNNFIHFVTANFLPLTIKKFIVNDILKYTKSKNHQQQIQDLAKSPNDDGVTPIEQALNSVYSERQFLTVQFLVDKCNIPFEKKIEERALNHLVDIFKFSSHEKLEGNTHYLIKFQAKFKQWESKTVKIFSQKIQDQKSQHLIDKVFKIYELLIQFDTMDLQKKLSKGKSVRDDYASANADQHSDHEHLHTNDSAEHITFKQDQMFCPAYEITKGQQIVLERGIRFYATIQTNNSVKKKSKWNVLKSGMGVVRQFTQQGKHEFQLLPGQSVSEVQTDERDKTYENKRKSMKVENTQSDLSESIINTEEAEKEKENVPVIPDNCISVQTQIYYEDIQENSLRLSIENSIMKSQVVRCIEQNLNDVIFGDNEKTQQLNFLGGHVVQIFYVMNEIRLFYPHGLEEYGRADRGAKKGRKEDIEYLKNPHKPKELTRMEHLTTFLLKYIRDLKNENIQILVSKKCVNYLKDECKCDLRDISKLSSNQLMEFKKIFTKNKMMFSQPTIFKDTNSIITIELLYELFIDIAAKHIEANFEIDMASLQKKIKLIEGPQDLDQWIQTRKAIVLLTAPQSVQKDYDTQGLEQDILLDDSTNNDLVIAIDQKHIHKDVVCINTEAAKIIRENILKYINRKYPELFLYNEEDLEQIFDNSNDKATLDVETFISNAKIPCFNIPIKIDMKGTYVQHEKHDDDIDPAIESLNEKDRIYTRCLQNIESNDLESLHQSHFQTSDKANHWATTSVKARKIKKVQQFNRYMEFVFNLFLEAIALCDLVGDVVFSIILFKQQHLGWFSISILSMLSPFFICYVPLLTYQKRESTEDFEKKTRIERWILIAQLTPLVLAYLAVLDILYLVIYLFLQLFFMITDKIKQLIKGKREESSQIQNKFDIIYATIIGMHKEDMKGFRRLRTISQFTFESCLQIILQIYILIKTIYGGYETDINAGVISISLLFAIVHASIEVMFINLEAQACRTSLLHYFIICFNARFGWVPFADKFSSITNYRKPGKYEGQDLNYEDMKSSLCGQNFKLEFNFTNSTCETLTNCIINQPREVNKDRIQKNLKLGISLNEVQFSNVYELVAVSDRRINLDINEVDLKTLLSNQPDRIRQLKNPEPSSNSDSMMEKMVIAGQQHMVKTMFQVGAKMNFTPSLYQLAQENKNYNMVRCLALLNYQEFIDELSLIMDHQCKYQLVINDLQNAEMIASLFCNPKWILSESYQQNILMRILKYFSDRQEKEAFLLIKAFCGPSIPFYLLKGEGQQSEVDLNSKIDLFTKNKSYFNRLIKIFPRYTYLSTKVGEKNVVEIQSKEAYYFSEIRMHFINHFSFHKVIKRSQNYDSRSSIYTFTSDLFGNNEEELDEDEINPFPLFNYDVTAKAIHLILKILSQKHHEISTLSKEQTKSCDHAIQVLGLDKHRDRYFARTRFGDLTQSTKGFTITRLKLPDVNDSFESRKSNQQSIVLPESEHRNPVQKVIEYKIPEDALAVKSIILTYTYYNGKVLLNLNKLMHQTSQIVSKQDDSEKWVTGEVYEEIYEVENDQLNDISEDESSELEKSSDKEDDFRNPRGYRDFITSAQGGDTIMVLFIGEKIKDVELNVKLYMKIK